MKRLLALLLILSFSFTLSACKRISDESSAIDSGISSASQDTISTSTDPSVPSTSSEDSLSSDLQSDNSSTSDLTDTQINESSEATSNPTDVTSSETTPDQPTAENCDTLGHNYTEKRTESTCAQKGTITKTCTRCGKSSTESLALKPHSYTKSHVALNGMHHNDVYNCSVCGHGYSQSNSHSWSIWKTTKQPTQTAAGEQARFCTVCEYVERQTLQKLPSASEIQTEVFNLINAERQKAGLSPLAYYHAGQSAADTRANEITGHFSHTRPDGTTCFTALDEANIDYRAAGENIAMGQRTAEEVMEDWMNSPGHRSNILNSDYTHVIVGYKDNAWVQLFIGI